MSGNLARASISKRISNASAYGRTACCRSASSTASRRAEVNTADNRHRHQPPPLPPAKSEQNIGKIKYYTAKAIRIPNQGELSTTEAKLTLRESAVEGKQELNSGTSSTRDPLQHIIDHPSASVVLRDACKCQKCKDPSTNQRNFNIADIPVDLKPSKTTQDAHGNWTIQWENDMPGWEEHTSVFTRHQISRLNAYMKTEYFATTQLWDKQTFEKDRLSITYEKYMKSDAALAEVLYYFNRHGLVLIKDVPEEEDSVKLIAQRIAAVKSTFYGETWDVRSVPDAKNVAYTSKYLGFHSDLLYTKEPPTVQYLHCLHNSTTGGESRFVDQFKAFDTLCFEDSKLANALLKTNLRYEYENDGFYYSDIKPIVQQRTTHYQFPLRKIAGHKDKRTLQIYRMFWSPPFLGSILGDNNITKSQLTANLKAMKKYAEILERDDLVYEEKMQPGTCVMFDNLRVLHARNEFDMNSGNRWLRGAYLEGGDIWSKEMQLRQNIAYFQRSIAQTS